MQEQFYFNSRLYTRGDANSSSALYVLFLFQFTPLHERQLRDPQGLFWCERFQFTPLHERQRNTQNQHTCYPVFQFTPLHERQQELRKWLYRWRNFNSRLYMRGSRTRVSVTVTATDFNSRLYMRGSINVIETGGIGALISIHASTWEAAVRTGKNHEGYSISIHASTWEAACRTVFQRRVQTYFNSRLYMRGSILIQ